MPLCIQPRQHLPFGLCLCIVLLMPLPAHASSRCAGLFKTKQYEQAAQCFETHAKQMPPGDQLSKFKKKLKALYLRNASISYQRLAEKLSDPDKARYYQQRAIQMLKQYLREKLCHKSYQCKNIQGSLYTLEKQLGLATLTLLPKSKLPATVQLKGYMYKKRIALPPTWTAKLRPGQYSITTTYQLPRSTKARKKTFRARISLEKSQTAVFALPTPQAPDPNTKTPGPSPLVWVLGGVGIASIIAGSISLGVAQSNFSKSRQLLSNPNKPTAREVNALYDSGVVQTYLGWPLLIVGVLSASAAGLLFALRPKSPPPPPSPSPPTKSLSF